MEKLKVLIFQNDQSQIDFFKDFLEAKGLSLNVTYLTCKDALAIIDKNTSPATIFDIDLDSKSTNNKNLKLTVIQDQKFILNNDITSISDFCIQKNSSGKSSHTKIDNEDDSYTVPTLNGREEKRSSYELIFKESLFIRSNSSLVKINFDDIYFLEADANYTKVNTTDINYSIRASLKVLQKKLGDRRFVRVHKSFLINLEKIEIIQSEFIQIMGKEIPIGRPQYSWLIRQITIL
jgi:DNA-binding LytR/AlgR family response regulator